MRKNTAKTIGCSILILAALSLSFGCTTKGRGLSDATAQGYGSGADAEQMNKRVRDYLDANEEEYADSESSPRGKTALISTARTALGTPYVRGGTSTDGFDCSGFVQWTFNQVGVKLPRTAREQSRVGRAIRNIDEMQVGDIVAFRHPKRGYHTGIYVGDGKFIHSPRKRTTVRINALTDPYFSGTFLGARRVNVSNEEEIAAAEKMLADYRVQEKRRSLTKIADNKRGSKNAKASRSSKQKSQSVAGAAKGNASSKNTSKASQNKKKEKSSTSKNTNASRPNKDKKPAAASTGKQQNSGKSKQQSAAKGKKPDASKKNQAPAKKNPQASRS